MGSKATKNTYDVDLTCKNKVVAVVYDIPVDKQIEQKICYKTVLRNGLTGISLKNARDSGLRVLMIASLPIDSLVYFSELPPLELVVYYINSREAPTDHDLKICCGLLCGQSLYVKRSKEEYRPQKFRFMRMII